MESAARELNQAFPAILGRYSSPNKSSMVRMNAGSLPMRRRSRGDALATSSARSCRTASSSARASASALSSRSSRVRCSRALCSAKFRWNASVSTRCRSRRAAWSRSSASSSARRASSARSHDDCERVFRSVLAANASTSAGSNRCVPSSSMVGKSSIPSSRRTVATLLPILFATCARLIVLIRAT